MVTKTRNIMLSLIAQVVNFFRSSAAEPSHASVLMEAADGMAGYDARNPIALKRLLAAGVKLHGFNQEFMRAAQKAAYDIYAEESAKNPAFKKIYESWYKFREDQIAWQSVAERSMSEFLFNNKPPRLA